MGKSLGDKIVMSSHLLLLAIVAVASASFPGLSALRDSLGFAVVID
jgi:hypothetical protein